MHPHKRSVLFVDYGISIRSPLCEGLFKKVTKNSIEVDSAGLEPHTIKEYPDKNACCKK